MKTIPGERWARAGLAALLLAAALCGCGQDEDSSILFERNPRTDTGTGPFDTLTAAVAANTTIQAPFTTGSSPALLAGHLADGFEGRPYFRFTSLPDSADVAAVLSATIAVMVRDRYGANTDSVMLSLYRASATWKADSLDYDATPHDETEGNRAGDFSPRVGAVEDTTRLSLRADALVASWIAEPDSNFGVFVGTQALDAMVRLYSVEANPGVRTPLLTLVYRSADGDTVTTTTSASADGYALRRPDPPEPGARSLEIAGGWALRSLIRFDADSLRAAIPEEATISRARLVLTVESAERLRGSVPLALYGVTTEWSEGSADSIVTASGASAVTNYGSGTLAFDIAGLVRNWLSGSLANNGMLIRSTVEPSDLTRLTVAGRLSETAASRPRLELVYTMPPGARP